VRSGTPSWRRLRGRKGENIPPPSHHHPCPLTHQIPHTREEQEGSTPPPSPMSNFTPPKYQGVYGSVQHCHVSMPWIPSESGKCI